MTTTEKSMQDKSLRQLLDGLLVAQRQDIQAFSGGHLNEANLYKPSKAQAGKTTWQSSSKPRPCLVPRMTPPQGKRSQIKDKNMQDTMFAFSIGTTGKTKRSPQPPSALGSKGPVMVVRRESTESQGSYSKNDDGVLVEELSAPEAMLVKTKYPSSQAWAEQDLKDEKNKKSHQVQPLPVSQSMIKDQNLARLQHTFLPGHLEAVTKKDQFKKFKQFEDTVLRKADSTEKHVLSGYKAVEHLEDKLEQALDSLHYSGYGPNFHRLQVYSDTFQSLIEDSATFGFILRIIKTEYDNYVGLLLDSQPGRHQVLHQQVEQLSARSPSTTHMLKGEMELVEEMEKESKKMLNENDRLRRELDEELEIATHLEPEEPPPLPPPYQEPTLELTDQIEVLRATILEHLDEINKLKALLRCEFVPSSVTTHLEQCIKETEVEIQKLQGNKDYFDRSIGEMEKDLQETIENADTTEKDQRRVWKKVNTIKSIGQSKKGLILVDSDSEVEDLDKWNWYIS